MNTAEPVPGLGEPKTALDEASPLAPMLPELVADPRLRKCLRAEPWHNKRLFRLSAYPTDVRGMPETRLLLEGVSIGDDLQNCIHAWLAQLASVPETTETLMLVLVDDPLTDTLDYRLAELRPRRGEFGNLELELVAGALGGPGFRDGTAGMARFHIPLGLAADREGRIFIGDTENRALRTFDPSSGLISTLVQVPQHRTFEVAGSIRSVPHDKLTQPVALAFDRKNRLHALDRLNGEIWRIDAGQAVRVYQRPPMSSGTDRDLSSPSAMAFDRDGGVLVTDSSNHRIARIDLATGSIETMAGTFKKAGHRDGENPLFDLPEGLAVGDEGRVYVSEFGNNTIRYIDPDGTVGTLAGRVGKGGHADGVGKKARFDAPSSLVYRDGQLFVAESHGLVIRRVDVATGEVSTLAGQYRTSGSADGPGTSARLSHHESSALGELPFGMVTSGGHLYLTDSGNHVIRRIVIETGVVSTVAGLAFPDDQPTPRALTRANGALFVTAGQAVYRHGPAGFQLVAGDPKEMGHRDGQSGRVRFQGPHALNHLKSGELVIGEVNGQLRLVEPDSGRVRTIADFDSFLYSIAVGDDGWIYVGSQFEISRVSKTGERNVLVSRNTEKHPAAIAVPSLSYPVSMVVDGDHLYVLDERKMYSFLSSSVTTLRRIDLRSGVTEDLASWNFRESMSSQSRRTRGLALTEDKSLVIAHATGELTRFDPKSGRETAIMIPDPTARGVSLGSRPSTNSPSDPLCDSDGSLLFIDEGAVLRLPARGICGR